MKFNHEKWDRLLRQQQAMHNQYIQFDAEWEEAKVQAGKTEANFVNGYDKSHQAFRVINEDKKLSAVDLEQRMEAIRNNWADLSSEFAYKKEDFTIQSALLSVYSAHLKAKRLYERRQQQGETNQACVASFVRLKEFASHHVKIDDRAAYPAQNNAMEAYYD
jgi:hypothetical protein